MMYRGAQIYMLTGRLDSLSNWGIWLDEKKIWSNAFHRRYKYIWTTKLVDCHQYVKKAFNYYFKTKARKRMHALILKVWRAWRHYKLYGGLHVLFPAAVDLKHKVLWFPMPFVICQGLLIAFGWASWESTLNLSSGSTFFSTGDEWSLCSLCHGL